MHWHVDCIVCVRHVLYNDTCTTLAQHTSHCRPISDPNPDDLHAETVSAFKSHKDHVWNIVKPYITFKKKKQILT